MRVTHPGIGARCVPSEKRIVLSEQFFGSDGKSGMELLGHEFGHALAHPDSTAGATKNEEALLTTLGKRINARYEGRPTQFLGPDGPEPFNSDPATEQRAYEAQLENVRKSSAYTDLPEDHTIFNTLEREGIEFGFRPDDAYTEDFLWSVFRIVTG